METSYANTKTTENFIASDYPVFISTVYLVTKPNLETTVKNTPTIEDAFNMWGKTISPSPPGEFAIFSSSLSYPFEFSKDGIHNISEALKKRPEVDLESISVNSFPNISAIDQWNYPDIFSKNLVIEEQYISFRLKDWHNVEFMRFPTFLVLAFDYSTETVDSPEAYSKISEYWRKKIEEFSKFNELRVSIGISDDDFKSRDVPFLTFVAAKFYTNNKYFSRYFGGRGEKSKNFLTEVSLRPNMVERSKLIGMYPLMHEYDTLTRWRFYYSDEPFFYKGNWRKSTYPGGVYGPSAKFCQVLRANLFVHIVMPNIAKQCQLNLSKVEHDFHELQQKRLSFLDQFSHSDLAKFQSDLSNIIREYRRVYSSAERAEEILSGLEQLKFFINSAFEPRRTDTFDSKEEIPSGIFDKKFVHEFFHLETNVVIHNDRGKANRYKRLTQNRLEKMKRILSRLQGEISEASSLLENRRNMLESKKNTILAIILPAIGAIFGGLIYWQFFIKK